MIYLIEENVFKTIFSTQFLPFGTLQLFFPKINCEKQFLQGVHFVGTIFLLNFEGLLRTIGKKKNSSVYSQISEVEFLFFYDYFSLLIILPVTGLK